MSPTAPTLVTLNDQLNKAHQRIRELQAREAELLAQNRTLCAIITELVALPRWESDGGAQPPRPRSQAQMQDVRAPGFGVSTWSAAMVCGDWHTAR